MIELQTCLSSKLILTLSIFVVLLPNLVFSQCNCENRLAEDHNASEALKYKLIAIASTLVASGIGVCLPIFAKNLSYLNPENDFYFLVKAFAAGVILATGFIHILPDAFEALTNPCIGQNPWGKFPFSGFVAMLAAIGPLIMEALVTGYHKRSELRKVQPLNEDDQESTHGAHASQVHSSVLGSERLDSSDLLRHSIVSQELGIVVHSMIVGVSLGASKSPSTIKPLVAALSFHQCFEGMGLGWHVQFKCHTITIMILFFCLTIPIGIGVGVGKSNLYHENNPTALVVQGLLLSASAGILTYMALVDFLATDFMNPKMLSSFRLQLWATFSLLLGVICMSILFMWGEP